VGRNKLSVLLLKIFSQSIKEIVSNSFETNEKKGCPNVSIK